MKSQFKIECVRVHVLASTYAQNDIESRRNNLGSVALFIKQYVEQ